MSDKITFQISSSVVRGALCASDGVSAFDCAPVVLATLDPPGGMMEAKTWGDNTVVGEAVSASDWLPMVKTDQAINLPSTNTPPHAALWVLRGNFANRSIAIGEAYAAGIVAKERRVPGRHGEQVQLVVDAKKGAPVLDVWRSRMTAAGVEKGRDGEWAEATQLFLASLAINMTDVHDVFRIIVAYHMDPESGTTKRMAAYGRLAKKWAMKRGRTATSFWEAMATVCNELGVDDQTTTLLITMAREGWT